MRYQIADLVTVLNCRVKGEANPGTVSGLAPFFQAQEDTVTFAAEEKFLKKLGETKAKYILTPDIPLPDIPGKTFLISKENPRTLMPKLLAFFKRSVKPFEKRIEDSAIVPRSAMVAPTASIGHDVVLGENVTIYPNAVICEGVEIGENTVIYPNVTIREFCKIGKNCVLQPGCVIGGDGFGFVKINGINTKIDQIGAVIVEDDVEIGANTTVDRGAIGDTRIGRHTKIDNLVQIAHNDIIGENCLIVAQVGISGSTEVGNNTTLAGQTGVAGHIKIGSNVVIGARGGVSGNIPDGQVLTGYPLVPVREDLKIRAALKRLPEIFKIVRELEKTIKD
ncbi:MAG: UDP-3-O-(3-hydroxymyristoyl)glucosamine N-acyltransferase [Fusobacteriaceae bacterium]|jgi:UDP-3-O-[3-hydroxymyristoyl] glucosamine N-acyltransferase|nr:UDP-3-O-(3-hydroxymyristoyl)glucosamine N-acyltransferase [Fusobacteriaceae bacterium]